MDVVQEHLSNMTREELEAAVRKYARIAECESKIATNYRVMVRRFWPLATLYLWGIAAFGASSVVALLMPGHGSAELVALITGTATGTWFWTERKIAREMEKMG